jgi:predicted alpha-1,2-mannosidase
MKTNITLIMMATFIVIKSNLAQVSNNIIDYTKFVNPLIGTARSTTISAKKHSGGSEDYAQVQPSVTVPFGMTNWTAETKSTEKKCLASYYYEDTLITGFRGSHWLSGSCAKDYGSMTVMPVFGKLVCNPLRRGSKYSHSDEVSTPYYYRVKLKDYGIVAEISATTRCGIMRFTFEREGEGHIIINPNNETDKGYIRILRDKGEIVGYNPVYKIYQGRGQAAGFSGYFDVKIEKRLDNFGVYSGDEIINHQVMIEDKPNIGAFISFRVKKGEKIIIKVGTSFVSIEEAHKNLESEIPEYDFDSIRNNLKNVWNKYLSKIKVEGGSRDEKVKFYTAMYHSFQQPRIYNDVDGSYPRFDGNERTDTIKIGNYYCDFSLWDTYRALHPLYNIIIPNQQSDMVRSLFMMAKAGGWLPIFPMWNSYTSEMIGDHAIAVAAESFVKGVINLSEHDYQILKHNANDVPSNYEDYLEGKGRRALRSYLKYGYIPLEDSVNEAFHQGEQVSRTLEYAYDDYALAQIAKKMGKINNYDYYMKRSENYKNVFDTVFHNVNGRYTDGSFKKALKKDKYVSFITEGTPWQYNWYVPQDVNGLIKLMGGVKGFNAELDKFFEAGQYWHGNEPSHQIIYLYDYSGQPWKVQKLITKTMNEEYGLGPGGLSGNDDSGQMSAWYIFSVLGFYPVCPVSNEYAIGRPFFRKIIISLSEPTKKTFTIIAHNLTANNIYVKWIKLDGKIMKGYFLKYSDLLNHKELEFEMTDKPNENNIILNKN